MNKTNLGLAITASLIFCSASALAASTGTITFNGELTDTTCDVSIDNGGADATVVLPTVSINTLTAAGDTNGRTAFNMNLSNCLPAAPAGKATVSTFFQPGTTVDLSTGRLNNTDTTGATNVQLQLLDVTGKYSAINVGNSSQVNGTQYVTIDQGTAFVPYAVEYYATAQTTPGLVTSSVVYNLQYK